MATIIPPNRYIPIIRHNKSVINVDITLLTNNTKARKLGIKKFPYIEYNGNEMSYYETSDGWWESNDTILLKNNIEKRIYKDTTGLLIERKYKRNNKGEVIHTTYKSNRGHVRISKMDLIKGSTYFEFEGGEWEFTKKRNLSYDYNLNAKYLAYDSEGYILIRDKETDDIIYTNSHYIVDDEHNSSEQYNLNIIAKREYNGIFNNNCIDNMNPKHIDWDLLSCYQYIPEEYIKKFNKYWNKKHLKFFQNKKYFGENPDFKGIESIY
jgi:hypothetical protein